MNSHDRPAAEEVIKGLSTTSAKIRALAEARYDRSEISKLLRIRYQFVRNVLVKSGKADLGVKGDVRKGNFKAAPEVTRASDAQFTHDQAPSASPSITSWGSKFERVPLRFYGVSRSDIFSAKNNITL